MIDEGRLTYEYKEMKKKGPEGRKEDGLKEFKSLPNKRTSAFRRMKVETGKREDES